MGSPPCGIEVQSCPVLFAVESNESTLISSETGKTVSSSLNQPQPPPHALSLSLSIGWRSQVITTRWVQTLAIVLDDQLTFSSHCIATTTRRAASLEDYLLLTPHWPSWIHPACYFISHSADTFLPKATYSIFMTGTAYLEQPAVKCFAQGRNCDGGSQKLSTSWITASTFRLLAQIFNH